MKINFDENRQRNPQQDGAMKVPYAPAKRGVARFRWYFILFVVTSPLLYLLLKMVYLTFVITAPGYITLNKISVNASASGIVAKIEVKPGDVVKPNDTLVILDNLLLNQREQVLQAEFEALNASQPVKRSGNETVLRDQIGLAKDLVDYQKKRVQHYQYLFEQGAATRAELDEANARYHQAQFNYTQVTGQLSALREKEAKEERDAAIPSVTTRVRNAQIKADLVSIHKQREALIHRATRKSKVLDIFIQPGEALAPGTNMLLLGDLKHTVVTCYLDPEYIRYSKTGSKAVLKFPDGKKVSATVVTDAKLVKRLPADLASPIGSRELQLVVLLVPDTPLPPNLMIDGLPVTVRFRAGKNLLGSFM